MDHTSSPILRHTPRSESQFVKQTLDFCDPRHGSGERHYAKIIDDVAKHQSQEAYALAGSMCLDLAARLETSENSQSYFLEKAHSIWQNGVNHSVKENPTHNLLTSRIGLACLPAFSEIIQKSTIPNIEIQNEMYRELNHIGYLAIELHNYYSAKQDLLHIWDSVGQEAELALLLLHQRFTRPNIPDSMLALPSYLSQDQGNDKSIRGKRTKWDISIFEELPPIPPCVVAKIQSKSTLFTGEDNYTGDITVIDISHHLGNPSNPRIKILKPKDIILEVINENYNPGITDTLNLREELLLDKLDEITISI